MTTILDLFRSVSRDLEIYPQAEKKRNRTIPPPAPGLRIPQLLDQLADLFLKAGVLLEHALNLFIGMQDRGVVTPPNSSPMRGKMSRSTHGPDTWRSAGEKSPPGPLFAAHIRGFDGVVIGHSILNHLNGDLPLAN